MLRYNENILNEEDCCSLHGFVINIIPNVNSRPIRGVSCPHVARARQQQKTYLEHSKVARITESYHISASSGSEEGVRERVDIWLHTDNT